MKQPSFLYTSPLVYHLVMRLLYGGRFEARYQAIAEEIPKEAQVIDLCAGDCYLYLKYLQRKSVNYLGLDISSQMMRWARKKGVSAREFDLWSEEVPPGDVIVLQASLYQFHPHAAKIVRKMLGAARQKVIISEPIINLSTSSNLLLARLAHSFTVPTASQGNYSGRRFNREAFQDLIHSFDSLERCFTIPGGREMVAIFRVQGRSLKTWKHKYWEKQDADER